LSQAPFKDISYNPSPLAALLTVKLGLWLPSAEL
jgi:hypothetical protein